MASRESCVTAKSMFTADTYQTDEGTPRYFLDRIMLGGCWVFLGKFLSIVFKSRAISLRGEFDTKVWANTSIEILKLIEKCGGRFEIEGLDNIRNSQGPTVFIGNHMSILETMIFPGIIAPVKEVTFVVKDSLVKHPVFWPGGLKSLKGRDLKMTNKIALPNWALDIFPHLQNTLCLLRIWTEHSDQCFSLHLTSLCLVNQGQ